MIVELNADGEGAANMDPGLDDGLRIAEAPLSAFDSP